MGKLAARASVVVAVVSGLLLGELALAGQTPSPARLPVTIRAEQAADHPDHVVVVNGDHLWKISGRHLDAVLGRDPTNEEISPYWRRVIETNLPHLRSGDPDLIYPGEVVSLPEAGG